MPIDIFLEKKNKKVSEVIKNKGIKNKTCLSSSYKFTLNNIKIKITKNTEINRDPITNIIYLL